MLLKLADRRARRRWSRVDGFANAPEPLALNFIETETARLTQRVNQALRAAQTRLSNSLRAPANKSTPTQTDWTWRPDPGTDTIPLGGMAAVRPGTRITPDTALFHDCHRREVTFLATPPAHDASDLPSTTIKVQNFEGTYLSLATDLPNEALAGLSRHHIVALDISLTRDCPLDAYARLNLRHGPNTDHIVAKLADGNGAQRIEFDLGCLRLDETRLTQAWLDLIFDSPAQSRITLEHMALHRRPRAEI